MKVSISILLGLFILACAQIKTVYHGEINNLKDVDEKTIKSLYDNVLDTLFQNHLIQKEPIKNPTFLPNKSCFLQNYNHSFLSDVNNSFDEEFTKIQFQRLGNFHWKKVLKKRNVISEKSLDRIFNDGIEDGWDTFRKKKKEGCICKLGLPIFSKNYKMFFVEYEMSCAPEIGFGEILVYKLVGNKWTLINKCPTRMS